MWNECGRFVGTKQHGDVQATFGCWFLNFVLIVPLAMMNLNRFKGLFVVGGMKVAIKNLGLQILVGKWHINSQGSLAKPCGRRSLNLRQRPTMWHRRMPSNELLPRWLSFVPSHGFFLRGLSDHPTMLDFDPWPCCPKKQPGRWTPKSCHKRMEKYLPVVSPAMWQTQWQTIPNRGFWNCVSPSNFSWFLLWPPSYGWRIGWFILV